jgi:hypothetical protein
MKMYEIFRPFLLRCTECPKHKLSTHDASKIVIYYLFLAAWRGGYELALTIRGAGLTSKPLPPGRQCLTSNKLVAWTTYLKQLL